MEPVRTCVGCRARAPKSSLVRIVAQESQLVVDTASRFPGRGAWMHPTLECFDKSIGRRAFGRALKVTETLGSENVARFLASKETQPESLDS
ncbi:YlxR family protein [Compostimonas suwonensis]|nr:YlxR family protein [Compostimonas suwonensis]